MKFKTEKRKQNFKPSTWNTVHEASGESNVRPKLHKVADVQGLAGQNRKTSSRGADDVLQLHVRLGGYCGGRLVRGSLQRRRFKVDMKKQRCLGDVNAGRGTWVW
jgi:hypothetical protein